MESYHTDQEPSFESNIVDMHKYNLQRQILESLYIEESQKGNHRVLNSKAEFSRGKLVRVGAYT